MVDIEDLLMRVSFAPDTNGHMTFLVNGTRNFTNSRIAVELFDANEIAACYVIFEDIAKIVLS